jgi:tRNA A37 methylthiotransferase MiaB
MTSPKSFHVKSFGCQMNVYDGDRMGELLESEGMVPAATAIIGRVPSSRRSEPISE